MATKMLRLTFFLNVLLLFTTGAYAQKDTLWRSTGKWSAWGVRYQTQTFGISEGKLDTCNCGGADRTLTQRGNVGLLVSYYRNVDTRFAYSVDFGASYGRVGTSGTPTLTAKSKLFTSLRGDLYYHLGKERQLISPYLHTGVHAQIGSMYASLPLGAGMRWMMKKSPMFITSQINYGIGLTSGLRNNLQTALGIYINLGSVKRTSGKPGRVNEMAPSPCDTDTDMDGVPDAQDGCPKLKGSITNGGCPVCDTDGDGIVDDKDKCPTVPGSMTNQGCPVLDSDGDGVTDDKDLCPTVAGAVSNMGCPAVDSDGDGITDDRDLCPTVKGTVANKGCPESAGPIAPAPAGKGIPQVIVYFDTDKYAIRPDAQLEIDRAVSFLSANPEYNVVLRGHTDVRASYAYNEKLSQNRVNAVKAKLMAAGIADSRISIGHFGEVIPAKEGDGEPNWQKNRRVEFTFVVR